MYIITQINWVHNLYWPNKKVDLITNNEYNIVFQLGEYHMLITNILLGLIFIALLRVIQYLGLIARNQQMRHELTYPVLNKIANSVRKTDV